MDLAYFKRYRMEMGLAGHDFTPALPPGYRFLAWHPSLLDAFAEAKYLSFRGEIDTNVFPCLGDRTGCRRLMKEISQKPGFLPEATWLVEYVGEQAAGTSPYCGTIQGIRDHAGLGAIQNVGVTPPHRNGGVGTAMLRQAMLGFQRAGLFCVYLEVTAENVAAIRLYHRFGFVTVKTVFKAVEAAYL